MRLSIAPIVDFITAAVPSEFEFEAKRASRMAMRLGIVEE
jgi:hypothetical protein